MEAELSGFTGGSNNQANKGVSQIKIFRQSKYLLYFSRVEGSCNSGYSKN